MSTSAATTSHPSTPGWADRRVARRWLYAALTVGVLWAVALTYVELTTSTTPDGHPFRHAADYWVTGLGIPLCISGLVIVHAVHALAAGRDGRRGLWGIWVFSLPALVFTAMFLDALGEAKASSWGPTYLLCVLATDVGLGLLVAGLWQSKVLPRKVLMLWLLGWVVGGPLGPPAAPLLLASAYLVLAVQLRRFS